MNWFWLAVLLAGPPCGVIAAADVRGGLRGTVTRAEEMMVTQDTTLTARAIAYEEQANTTQVGSFSIYGQAPHPVDGMLRNWPARYYFRPLKIVEAKSYEDVTSAVKDTVTYPSPVRALGSIHSVTEIVSNEGGTVVLMRGLNKILGLSEKPNEPKHATAQAGVTVIELQRWLAERGLEMAVAPEIGDSTLGGVCGCVTKDSSVPTTEGGTWYRIIHGVKYVDHLGNIATLTKQDNPQELALYKGNEGLLGITLEVKVVVVPRRLVKYTSRFLPTTAVVQNIGQYVNDNDNSWILLTPDISYVETRALAPSGAQPNDFVWKTVIAPFKQVCIQEGAFVLPLQGISLLGSYESTIYRLDAINSYYEPSRFQRREDFSWFEYPFERFTEVVTKFNQYTQAFAAGNDGWMPTAAAVFFVKRTAEKANGWFSLKGKGFEKEGLSFTLDPVYSNPDDPRWQAFLKGSVDFAVANGGRVSLTQTHFVTKDAYFRTEGAEPLIEAANKRFTTPFLAQFT